jgi:RNA polymerase sigma-70 factor (ECF subfamily)
MEMSFFGMSPPRLEGDAQRAADRVARHSYGKLVAYLAARDGNVAAAEDALSEAFISALSDWTRNGCPNNPEAWLLTAARRKQIDSARRQLRGEALATQLLIEDVPCDPPEIPDRRLALMFVCAHPSIEPGIRTPLILQLVLGLNAKTIASAFLTSPEAMSKRLVRAKERIRQAHIPFCIPDIQELSPRLDAVLEAIYAAFSEGWIDPSDADVVRRNLTEEAIYLARLVSEMLPDRAEPIGLLSLMLYSNARAVARRKDGEYVPLAEQDPASWDGETLYEAERLLRKAFAMNEIGRYQLEAALQSAHVLRMCTGTNNWREVVDLYDGLMALSDSPVVAINRSLALAQIDGPQVGLKSLQAIGATVNLAEYQPYWAALADLLAKTGATDQAHHAYEIAIGLERDPAVRRFLQDRQFALPASPAG